LRPAAQAEAKVANGRCLGLAARSGQLLG
jgi:hypothetical protein